VHTWHQSGGVWRAHSMAWATVSSSAPSCSVRCENAIACVKGEAEALPENATPTERPPEGRRAALKGSTLVTCAALRRLLLQTAAGCDLLA